MAEATLSVLKRDDAGKQAAKHLRLTGFVPGILYGKDIDNTSLSINMKDLLSLLHSEGRNAVVNLMIGDAKKEVKSFIYDIQHNPLSHKITHVDLKQISMTEKINVSVPVLLQGVPVGVKTEGGIIEHLMHTVEITCLPADIRSEFAVDISELGINGVVHVSDIKIDKYEYISDEDSVVVHVVAPKVIEEDVEGEEGIEEESVEPEVIGQDAEEE